MQKVVDQVIYQAKACCSGKTTRDFLNRLVVFLRDFVCCEVVEQPFLLKDLVPRQRQKEQILNPLQCKLQQVSHKGKQSSKFLVNDQ